MSYTPIGQLKSLVETILEYVSRLGALASAVGVLNDVRVTPTGTVTVAGNLTTVTNVTTVATLSNQSNVGGYAANPQIPALMNVEATLANIDNIIIS